MDADRVELASQFALQEPKFFGLHYKALHTQRSSTPKRMALLDTGGRTPGCVLNDSASFYINHNKYLCDFVSQLTAELKELDATLERLTNTAAKRLRNQFGVGPQTAAILLAVAGDNPERLRSEAALAAQCGVNPLSASSGKTVRHRLNRGGSRAANNALWTIAMVRMRSDPRTQA